MPSTNQVVHRTRLSQRYDADGAGAAHWLVVLIGALVIVGGGAAIVMFAL